MSDGDFMSCAVDGLGLRGRGGDGAKKGEEASEIRVPEGRTDGKGNARTRSPA